MKYLPTALQMKNEREKTAELIRPILRGRDIKRYRYEWANLYLMAILTSRHNGVRGLSFHE
jgi:hypothetical protein